MLQGFGGDRWQPPAVINNNEDLIRPKPAEEEQQPDQQDQEDQLHQEEEQQDKAVKSAVDPSDIKVEQGLEVNEDEHRPSERSAPANQLLLQLLARAKYGLLDQQTAASSDCCNSFNSQPWPLVLLLIVNTFETTPQAHLLTSNAVNTVSIICLCPYSWLCS